MQRRGWGLTLTQLALRRAGAADLKEFQIQEGLPATGMEDVPTMQRLTPYLLGYRRYRIRAGDTFDALARANGITVQSLRTANPEADPERLQIGADLTVPMAFPVVPTDLPFTSQLLELCARGLTARYPFLTRENLGATAFGRPLTLLKLGTGRRSVL